MAESWMAESLFWRGMPWRAGGGDGIGQLPSPRTTWRRVDRRGVACGGTPQPSRIRGSVPLKKVAEPSRLWLRIGWISVRRIGRSGSDRRGSRQGSRQRVFVGGGRVATEPCLCVDPGVGFGPSCVLGRVGGFVGPGRSRRVDPCRSVVWSGHRSRSGRR